MLKRVALFLAFTLTVFGAENTAEDANLKYFKDLAETRNYTLGRPVSPKITPDGAFVIFLRAAPRNPTLRLYEFTIATGVERELLSPEQILGSGEEKLSAEEKARRERMRQSLRGFTSFSMSFDGAKLLVILSGKLYVVSRADLKFTELPGENWIDPRFSPDGRYVSAVKGGELHTIDLASNTASVVTTGAGGAITNATAEFVAQEEMNRFQGYWWSPDASQFLYQQTDESAVETRYIANALHPEEKPASFAYPKAGSPNAVVRVGLIARAGGETRWVQWDNQKYPYLARVTWENANSPLTLLVQNRTQTEQVLLAVDQITGAVTELLKETDPAWLNLDANWSGAVNEIPAPLWLSDGRQFLWATEQRGGWQIELREASGKLVREITPLKFGYRGLLGIDESSGSIFVRGSLDAREVHLWRFPLAGGEGTALTNERGHHTAFFAKKTGKLVHTFDLFDGSYGARVLDLNGQLLATMKVTAENPARFPTTELTRTRSLLPFDAAITRPTNFKAGAKYPVILQVYAGPTSKRVNATIRDYLPDQWMADQGYIVVRLDGRGTPWQGRDWERIIKGNFIDTALNDQVTGLQALASHYPEIDLMRVGVTGWSWGGYFSAMAAIRRPDVFRGGVVGAPVITWENYDTHYTERYLGLPQDNSEAYRISNVTTYVNELRRPLMLIHGLTDDNVYFQHTLQLADALFMAGKPYELLPMLGTHMISDPLVRLRQQQRIMDFFNFNVKGVN
ncbi:DPP IV N-terminal domain-containing protein [Oleiharenicola lentus]|uniref:S9 family peptidase n=1 Tax=Oleiharenicola lentus TaxID=2508720 RepID=UPI003F67CC72